MPGAKCVTSGASNKLFESDARDKLFGNCVTFFFEFAWWSHTSLLQFLNELALARLANGIALAGQEQAKLRKPGKAVHSTIWIASKRYEHKCISFLEFVYCRIVSNTKPQHKCPKLLEPFVLEEKKQYPGSLDGVPRHSLIVQTLHTLACRMTLWRHALQHPVS